MKNYLRLILYPLVLILLFLRYAPVGMVKTVASVLPDAVIEYTRPEAREIATNSSFPADTLKLVFPKPKWIDDPDKQRQLVSKFKYESLKADKDVVRLNDLYFLRAGKDFLVTYHRRNHEILVLSPQLNVVRMWPVQLRNGVRFDAPIDLEVVDEKVYAIDRQGRMGIWSLDGVESDHFDAPEPARDFALLPNGDFLVHDSVHLPWMISRLNHRGQLLSRFAPQHFADSTLARFMLQGILAVDQSRNMVALASKSPYRIFIYNTTGQALRAIDIQPNFQVAEPIIERNNGKIVKVGYQKVVFDILWHQGFLWALVSSEMGKAPQWLETFNVQGEFLQRFALLDGVSRFAFLQEMLYVLGYAPNYRIEAYDILPVGAQ